MERGLASDFKKHVVTNFKEYLDLVRELKTSDKNLWFRGQSNASFQLIPSTLRETYEIKDQFNRDINPVKLRTYNNKGNQVAFVDVYSMLQEFKDIAKQHLRIQPENDLEWYFLAQHYGIPTTLLDWSTDPLVALFFAMPEKKYLTLYEPLEEAIKDFEEDSYSYNGAAVFVINPGKVNEILTDFVKADTNEFVNFPLDANKHFKQINEYMPNNVQHLSPCCITSTPIDKRICRQSGNFTIHGHLVWPLDHTDVVRKEIHKIFIPYQCIEEIKNMLDILDITYDSIYGYSELDAITKNISKENHEKLRAAIDKLKLKYEQSLMD